MAQSSLLILAEPLEQPLGAELQAILQQEPRYQVTLCAGLLPPVRGGADAAPDVLILVLPAAHA